MQQRKKNTHLFTKTTKILVFCFILLCRPSSSFAQASTEPLLSGQLVQFLNYVIGVVSWIWIIPAKLAGILMTNYFVYGSSFYLVDYLFKFWQIIRTFALYGLGLYFVGYTLYLWFSPEAKSKIADLFTNTLIAGVLISMSRWLIAASVDISIVFTSAVASIPSQIYEQQRETRKQCFSKPISVPIKADLGIDADLMGNPDNHEAPQRIEIKPEGSDISGPLMFFGASVLKFFDNVYLPEQQFQGSSDANQQRESSKTLIIVLVKALLAIMLIVPMVILMVVNLIRVVYLRLWIVFSPGIVLINIFDIQISDKFKKHLGRHNALGLIMQPVAIVAMLSIGLIFIIELSSVFNMCIAQPDSKTNPLQTSVISEGIDAQIGESANAVGSETTLGASLSAVGDFVGGVTGQIIMALFVIILMWALIKIGFSFSELTSETAKKMSDDVEDMVSAIPLVPLPGIGRVGMGAVQESSKGLFGLKTSISRDNENQTDMLKEKLGLGTGAITNRSLGDLTRKVSSSTPLQDFKKSVQSETKKHFITTQDAQRLVTTWLKSSTGTRDNRNMLKNQLQLDGLAIDRSGKEEDLNKIRESTSPHYKDSYKLLNRLFGGGTGKLASDSSTTVTQYGPYEKDE